MCPLVTQTLKFIQNEITMNENFSKTETNQFLRHYIIINIIIIIISLRPLANSKRLPLRDINIGEGYL